MALKFSMSVSDIPQDSGASPTIQKSQLSALLGQSYFKYTEEGKEVIYDFNSKKIYKIDRSKGNYSEKSLFADVGFRIYELQNRIYLNGILNKAGAKDNPVSLVFSEHELSITSKDSDPNIERSDRNHVCILAASGKDILSIGKSRIIIPEKYHKSFIRFFRYRFGGHPSILYELVTPSGISKDITITHTNLRSTAINLHLKSAKEISSVDYSLKGMEAYFDIDSRLQKLITRIGVSPIDERKNIANLLINNSRNSIEKNNYLD